MPIAPPFPLKICIAGAGIAGLSVAISLRRAGFDVTVYESAQQLSEIGAGVQACPNASRIMERWGILASMENIATSAEETVLRRYSDGSVLSHSSYDALAQFGSPHWSFHRAQWQLKLYEQAIDLGAKIQFGKRVKHVDVNIPCLEFADGSRATADLIIAADGVRSTIRAALLSGSSHVFDLGLAPQCIYRMLIPAARMSTEPYLASLMSHPCNNLWFGPGTACMGYVIQTPDGHSAYNLAMTHLEDAPPGSWSDKGDMRKVREWLAGFEPTIQKILDRVDDDGCLRWGLSELPEFPSWSDPKGKILLVGDAAHAIFPHIGQGAGMALEDAVSLTEHLKRARSATDIPHLLKLHEMLRKPRVERMKAAARTSMGGWLLEDGPAQEKRDASLRAASTKLLATGDIHLSGIGNCSRPDVSRAKPSYKYIPDMSMAINGAEFREWMYETDIYEMANEYLDEKLSSWPLPVSV